LVVGNYHRDVPSILPRPLIYAHRGGAALRPENTIKAFDHGLSLGADGLELDVHLSRDGEVVVHHDDTLERTTSGRGRLADYTADELARLDAAHWFQPRPSDNVQGRPEVLEGRADGHGRRNDDPNHYPFRGRGVGIPRLREVLQRYPETPLIVELKADDEELARRAVSLVRSAGALDRVRFGSFHGRVLRAARACDPAVKTGAATEETRWALYRSWVRWPLGSAPYAEFQVPERSGATVIVTPRFIDYAHRAGLPVKVWTVDHPSDMTRLLDWGADALITDRPDIAVDIARSR
jgi:glycerophosphoryl diester phosphodiesterase